MKKNTRVIYQLKISLKGIRPPIWRKILISSTTTLADLHEIFQCVMGWTDSHLHQFEIQNIRYGVPDPEYDEDICDESKYAIRDLLKRESSSLVYEYDFGDAWEHSVKLEKIFPFDPEQKLPFCTGGRRACPPEDVGGIWGYPRFLEVFLDDKHSQHEEMVEWAGDYFQPENFDLKEVNEMLQKAKID